MTESTQHKASDGSEISFDGPRAPVNPPATKEAPAVVPADTAGNSHSVVTGLLRRDIEDLPISERTCLLQNYGILQESGVQEVENSVKVFDYNVEHIDDGHSHLKAENPEITIRGTDKQAEVSLDSSEVSLDSSVVPQKFLDLWYNPDPNNIYLRVMDFPNIKKATQEFLPNAKKMIQKEIKNNIYKMEYAKNKMSTVTKNPVLPDDIGDAQNSSPGKTKGVDNFDDSYKNRVYSEISIQDEDADSELVKHAEDRAKEEMKQFRKILIPEKLPTLKSSIPVFFNCSDEGQTLILGVSLPYFSLGTLVGGEEPESFGLSKYMSLGRDQNKLESVSSETTLEEARVHNALLMVFNNEMIAIFRSKEDTQSARPPPLFRHQERHGAYRSLVTIISNILKCPQKKIFNFFEDKLCEQQCKVTYRMSVRPSTSTDGLGIISDLQSLNTDISALNIVVKSQIGILKELRQIYENTFHQENTYDRNAIKIPLLWEMKEQIGPALLTIDKIIGERNLFYENLKDLVKGVRKLQKSFSSFINVEMATNSTNGVHDAIQDLGEVKIPQQTTKIVNAIETQTKETGNTQTFITNTQTTRNETELKRQTEAIVEQHRATEKQARVMTALMFITMVFLPLSFFSSYLGMNEGWVHRARSEHTIFWAISAPITLVIGVLTCWFDHVYEDWPRKWKEMRKGPMKDVADAEKGTPTSSTDPTRHLQN